MRIISDLTFVLTVELHFSYLKNYCPCFLLFKTGLARVPCAWVKKYSCTPANKIYRV